MIAIKNNLLQFKNDKYYLYTNICLILIFLTLRIINIGSSYISIDDILTMGPINPLPGSMPMSLSEILHYLTTVITGPILPTVILNYITNLIGLNLGVLRIPSIIASLISFCYLKLLLEKLFSNKFSILIPLLFFTFSVPSIIYSQTIQPSIFYFLTTVIQIYVFTNLICVLETNSIKNIEKKIRIFTRISTLLFLFNYMSILIYGLLLASYCVLFIVKKFNHFSKKEIIFSSAKIIIELIPLFILTVWRLRIGDTSRLYFRGLYYIDNFFDIIKLSYDFISYHLNFAYSPNLYSPLKINAITIPFLLITILGLISFLIKRRLHIILFIFSFCILYHLSNIEMLPFGGVRHSFLFAPFIFILTGYGIELIYDFTKKFNLPTPCYKIIIGSIISSVIIIFFYSGKTLYKKRKTTMNITKLYKLALENNVRQIVGYRETAPILLILDDRQTLSKAKITINQYTRNLNINLKNKYLLVGCRYAFNPKWKSLWNAHMPINEFKNVNVIPLEENIGPLDPRTTVQSIYYPINGSFVYLIEPK